MWQRPSRGMWISAILVSVICVGGLAWGLVQSWDEPPRHKLAPAAAREGGSGFGLGLMLGIGAGIAIGSVIALRRRH
jgi:hypothetical protein